MFDTGDLTGVRTNPHLLRPKYDRRMGENSVAGKCSLSLSS